MIKTFLLMSILFFSGCYKDADNKTKSTTESSTELKEQGEVRQLNIDISGLHHGNILKIAEKNDLAEVIRDGKLIIETIYDSYWISIDTQPEGQLCNIINGRGTSLTDVFGISIQCMDNDKNGTIALSNSKKYMTANEGVVSFRYPEELPLKVHYFRDIDDDVTLTGLFFDSIYPNGYTESLEEANDNLISVSLGQIANTIDTVYHFDDGEGYTSIYNIEINEELGNMEAASSFLYLFLKNVYGFEQKRFVTSSVTARTGSALHIGISSKKIDTGIVFIMYMTLTTDFNHTIDAFTDLLNPERIMDQNQSFSEAKKEVIP